MKYITALFLPSPAWDGRPGPTARFSRRYLKTIHLSVRDALPRLEDAQRLLGDDLLVVLDTRLKSHPLGAIAHDLVAASHLNVMLHEFPGCGAWSNKWRAILFALQRFKTGALWMDFMDTTVVRALNADEAAFLSAQAARFGVVVEWERFRCLGASASYSNGESTGAARIKQPQTSISYFASDALPHAALETRIDHDQIALLHVLQDSYGLYQDVLTTEKMMLTSSRGLFRSQPVKSKCLTCGADLFAAAILHK